MASAAVLSKAVVMFLLIHRLLLLPLFCVCRGVCVWSLFCFTVPTTGSQVCNYLARKLYFNCLLKSWDCLCSASFPHGSMGWSAGVVMAFISYL